MWGSAPRSARFWAGVVLVLSAMSARAEPSVPVTFSEVSIHDPSIIRAQGRYYVFGSHLEAARSVDLMRWETFTNGYRTPGNRLFGDLVAALSESFAWAGHNDADSFGGFAVWAPDVVWMPEFVNPDGSRGAYLMYYAVSSTYVRSAIGIAASSNVEGPYRYVDTIIYSGFTRDEAYDRNSTVNKKWTNTNIPKLIAQGKLEGVNPAWFRADGSYNNSVYPNAIDPNVFRDADGNLWLAYGSWSGGIFVLRIDPTTGRPVYPGRDGTTPDGRLVDRYFGIKIAGGYGKSGEGPYVVYDRDTRYYYLFVSYGWLGATGGYNIRVFRSRAPTGPYLDSLGQSAVLPGDVDNAPYGNKLMGGFLFERKLGDPGIGRGVGYVSPGHNSVYVDEDSGQRFLVFHTRLPGRGEYHELRVHQFFLNQDGWPVVAPYRYAGEQLRPVDEAEIPGDYRYVNHGKSNSNVIQRSTHIKLQPDHTITGAVTGTWRKVGDYYVEITMDGTTYRGVLVRCWEPIEKQYVVTFTALSEQGVAIWGARLPDRTDEEVVAAVWKALNLGDTSRVTWDLALPTEGTRGTRIVWQSSDPQVVDSSGSVRRPGGTQPVVVVLTATITRGSASAVKTFFVTVPPAEGSTPSTP